MSDHVHRPIPPLPYTEERRKRDGRNRGLRDGETCATWYPPYRYGAKLPRIDLHKLEKCFDQRAYLEGFQEAYYRRFTDNGE